MNRMYKNLIYVALSTLVCVSLAMPASAQRNSDPRPSGGGGGGGSSMPRPSSGGGGSSIPRPSGGSVPRSSGNVGVRPPSGNVGVARPGNGGGQRPAYVNRPGGLGGGASMRGNYGYAPRTGGVSARGNFGFAPRVGVNVPNVPRSGNTGGVQSYRSSPRIGYSGNGYWGNHGYYHYSHGYYNSYYRPRLGFTCGFLPFGYYPFYFGDYQYFYSDGLFYQYDNSEYTVVEPPIGAQIDKLPEGAQSIVINGQQYYELNGVYYQPVTKDDGTVVYQIAGKDGELNTNSSIQDDQPQGPQLGDIVTQLPSDCRKIKVNGEKLYVSPDGVYYLEKVDSSGNKTYKVVGLPSDEPDQN